ncbi:molybdopterin-guanine dinucleotide biosynthesis protein B [Bacillus sp. FJAT-50079]|uniref:molybdopterin-guanine dinucleotide biosynthesis protein B n=1 Tax=Bacillus sp. FJAT-50079 TaxID=2833577 RepID=UPI001BCA1BB6|nr:molybdopterin-guanine dinucleotide biosynthesis protein B [Bacillus sp. FJAT-50079]MBS4209895.1 molybdopterin-guanine dinucleotide biosynthesis protein B [Bacillus sp. FJAT-50079]
MAGSKIFQVVGYQNSGKTTLMEKMIQSGSGRGLAIGTIKHHGHGGVPLSRLEEKDSDKHRAAGAIVTAVEGEGIVHIEASQNTLQKTIAIYESLHVDLILVEGYKMEEYPKVVLIRRQEDLYLLNQLANIKAVISAAQLQINMNIEVFSDKEMEKFVAYFYRHIYGELGC